MEYLRRIDLPALHAADERITQVLLDSDSGATSCRVTCTKTPAGDGSPSRLHTHVVDQMFYILAGTMNLEVAGKPYEAGPGTLVVLPAGVPHRNWNGGSEPTVHLAFVSPLPPADRVFTRLVRPLTNQS